MPVMSNSIEYTYQSISHSFLAGTNHFGGMQTSHEAGTVLLHRPLNGSSPRLINWALCWSAQIKLPLQSSSVSQSRTSHILHGLAAVHATKVKIRTWALSRSDTCIFFSLAIIVYYVRGTRIWVVFCAIVVAMKHKAKIRIDDCIMIYFIFVVWCSRSISNALDRSKIC
jgi:hypothetical protein